MDLVSGFGEAGFRWIFAIDIHGPFVNKAMTEQASRYFEDTYGGTMVNLTGVLDPDAPAKPKQIAESDRKEDGLAVHAGLTETSWLLYVRPDLVNGERRDARPVTAHQWDDYAALPNEEDWPGYFGSPRLARADVGGDWMEVWAVNAADLALRIIDGFDHRKLARLSEADNPAIKRLDGLIAEKADRTKQMQNRWLEANGLQ